MDILDKPIVATDVEARLAALAARHARAGNIGIELLNIVGGQAETLLDRLPKPMRARLGEGTEEALRLAMKAAHGSRKVVENQPSWMHTFATTMMGAAGGMGGLPSAMAELPVTTTILLRAIQDVAMEHGFDPNEPSVQFDCIQVFASAGPLERDDGSDTAFLTTRMAVTGAALNSLISKAAPRFSVVLGQKLATQTIPVLGAVAGATTNYIYTSYYQQMAHVQFGLRRLAIDADRDHSEIIEAFRAQVQNPPVSRMG